MAALDGEGGGFAVTGGADADVTAGVDVGACGGGGGGGGGAVVCAAAKGEGGVEAAQGAGVLAHGINGVFGAQGGGEAGQGVEAGSPLRAAACCICWAVWAPAIRGC